MKSFPDDKNVTESKFYLYKFCMNFGDCKCIKAQISPKKGIACPKAEQAYTSESHTFIGRPE